MKYLATKRPNPETDGGYDYYYPMEIKTPADREAARARGLEIGLARIGVRTFEAAFVPCIPDGRKQAADGQEGNARPSTEVQRRLYLDLIAEEDRVQKKARFEGRCQILNQKGESCYCPLRLPNPKYAPGNGEPKTIPTKCKMCAYEPFKQEYTTVPLSTLAAEDEEEEVAVSSPHGYYEAEKYEYYAGEVLARLRNIAPELLEILVLLLQEFTVSEIARKLGIPRTTVIDRRKKIRALAKGVTDDIILP